MRNMKEDVFLKGRGKEMLVEIKCATIFNLLQILQNMNFTTGIALLNELYSDGMPLTIG